MSLRDRSLKLFTRDLSSRHQYFRDKLIFFASHYKSSLLKNQGFGSFFSFTDLNTFLVWFFFVSVFPFFLILPSFLHSTITKRVGGEAMFSSSPLFKQEKVKNWLSWPKMIPHTDLGKYPKGVVNWSILHKCIYK